MTVAPSPCGSGMAVGAIRNRYIPTCAGKPMPEAVSIQIEGPSSRGSLVSHALITCPWILPIVKGISLRGLWLL